MKPIVTLADLEAVIREFGDFYGLPPGLGPDDVLLEAGKKIDAPMLSSTTGAFTAIAELMFMAGVSNLANVFGSIPKVRHTRSAYREITARGSSGGGGRAESAAIPDTVKPTIVRPSFTVKTESIHFDMSRLLADLGEGEDEAVTWAQFLDYMREEFAYVLNADMTVDNGTLAGNNFESVDRIFGSFSEIDQCDDGAGAAYDVGDLDINNQDRDAAASVFDAYVNHGGTGATETDRDFLGAAHLNTLFQNCAPFWMSRDNKVFWSPFDVQEVLNEIEGPSARYVDQVYATFGVNGIQTNPGRNVGVAIAAYRQVPWVTDNALQSDTIGRVNLADLDYLRLDVVRPVTLLDTGDNLNAMVPLGKYAREAAHFIEAEPISRRYPVHGKLRGLK